MSNEKKSSAVKKVGHAVQRLHRYAGKAKDVTKQKIHHVKEQMTGKTDTDLNISDKNKEIAKKLSELMQIDIDAAEIYQDVIENVKDNEGISNNLIIFRKDHLRHINDLTKWVSEFGGQPPERSPDLKGLILSGYTKLRGSIGGVKGSLNALHSGEKITNQAYSEIIKLDVQNKVLEQLLKDNYEDEKRHIKYVEEQLQKLEG